MTTVFKFLTLFLVLFTVLVCRPEAALASYSQVEDIASGGPYRADNRRIQRFGGQFTLNQSDVKRHMVLVLHNGFSDSPGFSWLRIFLCGDIDASSLGTHEEPIGDLLLDENPVQRHVIRIDLTDLVSSGTNTIFIEGKGQKGALLTWNLEGALEPKVADLNPSKTRGGARLTLAGSGFSADPDENLATFNGKPGKVLSSSRSTMTIEVPNTLKKGQADLEITTNGLKSAPYLINVEPLPEVFGLEKSGGISSDRVEITGRHLGTDSSNIEVLFGEYKARVLQASPGKLTVAVPPQIYSDDSHPVKVSVAVDNTNALGTLWYSR